MRAPYKGREWKSGSQKTQAQPYLLQLDSVKFCLIKTLWLEENQNTHKYTNMYTYMYIQVYIHSSWAVSIFPLTLLPSLSNLVHQVGMCNLLLCNRVFLFFTTLTWQDISGKHELWNLKALDSSPSSAITTCMILGKLVTSAPISSFVKWGSFYLLFRCFWGVELIS